VFTLTAQLAHAARAELAECPVWDDRHQCLWWVDILAGVVHNLDPLTGKDRAISLGEPVGSLAMRDDGGLILATSSGFVLWDDSTPTPTPFVLIEAADSSTRMNDGACDTEGRFWAGTMAHDATPQAGSLYRLEPDGSADRVIAGVTISNGIGWSPDSETMYYVDSATHRLDAFDYNSATGTPTRRRTLVEFDEREGLPDGIEIDAAGGIWVALWGGWQVRRFSPEGELTATVDVPVERVSSCTLGGSMLMDLFITTARAGPGEKEKPGEDEAGGLFHVKVDVPGISTKRFAGPPARPAR